MCIIFYQANLKDYPLILAANRDEFLARSTAPAGWHDKFAHVEGSVHDPSNGHTKQPNVLSGLDLEAGGTWLGLSLPQPSNPSSSKILLRFGSLTNFSETVNKSPKPSRGDLVKDFLAGPHPSDPDAASTSKNNTSASKTSSNFAEYSLESDLNYIETKKEVYAGFNLLLGQLFSDGTFEMGYISNRENPPRPGRMLHKRASAGVTIKRSSEVSGLNSSPPTVSLTRSTPEAKSDGKEERGGSYYNPEPLTIGMSNSTLEASKGEEKWPKVISGCADFATAIEKGQGQDDSTLIDSLWTVLSTAIPNKITDRSQLRHTVLVMPTFFNPNAVLSDETLPFEPLPAAKEERGNLTSHNLKSYVPEAMSSREHHEGGHWYATRVQTVVVISRRQSVHQEKADADGLDVTFIERDAFVLDSVTKKPTWSGEQRRFHFHLQS